MVDSISSTLALCKTSAMWACSSLLKWLKSGSWSAWFCTLADLGIENEFEKKLEDDSKFGVEGCVFDECSGFLFWIDNEDGGIWLKDLNCP